MVAWKVVIFRAVSFTATLLAARVWFGDWHVGWFQVFLLAYCTAIHYAFEKAWQGLIFVVAAKCGCGTT